jgi:hypothetical protein
VGFAAGWLLALAAVIGVLAKPIMEAEVAPRLTADVVERLAVR